MLFDQETENRVTDVIKAVASAYAVYLIGRELGQTFLTAAKNALGFVSAARLTPLETAFLAGKAATIIGTDNLKNLSEQQLMEWLRNANLSLTEADQATLNLLRAETERWMTGRANTWAGEFGTALTNANRDWRATIATTDFNDAREASLVRNGAMQMLIDRLKDQSAGWRSDTSRLLQTEMSNYFQQGQTSGQPKDSLVYKIPRPTACEHCLRIHTNRDGSPKTYRLGTVAGNSNIGRKAYEWQFTISPVHPWCYCVLHYVRDKAPTPSKTLAAAHTALEKSAKRANQCGIPSDPNLLFEDQRGGHQHPKPPHQVRLIKALTDLFGERLPGG